MSIDKFVRRVCVQTAVYWGNPVNDGYGAFTYDEPREIKCRWTDKERIQSPAGGQEIHQKAEVLVYEDLDLQGWLYLGNLIDIEDELNNYEVSANPMNISGAFQIIAVDKTPMIRSNTIFVRIIYLGFGNVQN